MLQQSSQAIPIYPGYVANISASPYHFGASAWDKGYGLKGCGCGPFGGCGCSPTTLAGLKGHGGHSHSMGGRSSYGTLRGFGEFGQTPSWGDQIAIAAGNWLSSIFGAPIQVGPTATGLPPVPGSIPNWVPWAIGGFVVYKLLK